MIMTQLTPVGGSVLLGDALRLGGNRRVAPMELDGPRMPRAFQPWGASLLLKKNDVIIRLRIAAIWWWRETMEPSSPSELGRGRMAPLGRNVGMPQRGMWPAGVIGLA